MITQKGQREISYCYIILAISFDTLRVIHGNCALQNLTFLLSPAKFTVNLKYPITVCQVKKILVDFNIKSF